MGCYDTIFLELDCPYCGQRSEMEFQTKDLEQRFCEYREGDKVPGTEQFKYLTATGDCHSPECQERADKLWISIQGCPSGFGSPIDAKVELVDGVITGRFLDIKIDSEYSDEFLEGVKDKWKAVYKSREKTGLFQKLWERQKR